MANIGQKILPAVRRGPCISRCHYLRALSVSGTNQGPFYIAHRSMSKEPHLKTPSKVRQGILGSYFGYVTKLEEGLEQKSPKAYKYYMLIKEGMREFYYDFKLYMSVAMDIRNDRPLSSFKCKELETYQQMPSNLLKMLPILVLSAPPLMNYIVFPLAFYFPRQLLCTHFWTPKQRVEFSQYYFVKHQLHHIPRVYRSLQRQTRNIKDPALKKQFEDIINVIDDKRIPSIESVLEVQSLFNDRPFGLDFLCQRHKLHMFHVAKSLNLSSKTKKMQESSLLLHHIDMAMAREGVTNLSLEHAQQATFQRGLDASSLSLEELHQYLSTWTEYSRKTENTQLSFLLHLPVFIAMNHQGNLQSNQKVLRGG